MSDIMDKIKNQIVNTKVILYMKGNKQFPQCGFSAQVVQILNSYNIPYETVDVLLDPEVRQGIKDYTNWPTIPQLYVSGQFVGGCDICLEMHHSGELEPLIKDALSEQ
jgi:monothiol glutaredoxin